MTIDTGSNITLVRPDIMRRPGKELMLQSVGHQLRTVTEETSPIHGICTSEVTVGSFKTSHQVWVADITDACILGLDFLRQHKSSVDLREGILYLGEEEIPLQYVPSLGELVCQHCFASISVTVPPFSEMLIPARINPLTAGDKWYILEPNNASLPSGGILVG